MVLCRVRRIGRTEPVSYTHLDVYKRQVHSRTVGKFYDNIVVIAYVNFTIGNDGIVFVCNGNNISTVSYTHLDVYKRQPSSCARSTVKPLSVPSRGSDVYKRQSQHHSGNGQDHGFRDPAHCRNGADFHRLL